MKSLYLKKEAKPINIVMYGAGTLAYSAYRQFCRKHKREMQDGKLKIYLLSDTRNYTCYGWMYECINQQLGHENLAAPLEAVFPGAEVIYGKAVFIDQQNRQVHFAESSGKKYYLEYDHLIMDQSYFSDHLTETKSDTGFLIQSGIDLLKTTRQLAHLVSEACRLRDRISASRLLRITICGTGEAGFELAVAMAAVVKKYCDETDQLKKIRPTIYLVTENDHLLKKITGTGFSSVDLTDHLRSLGIKYLPGKKVIRVNADGAILQDGSFINCSLVYSTGTSTANTENPISPLLPGQAPIIDKYSKLYGSTNIWLTALPEDPSNKWLPGGTAYMEKLSAGKQIANNIRNVINHKKPAETNHDKTLTMLNIAGGFAYASYGSIAIKGFWPWMLRLITLIWSTPRCLRKTILKKLIRTHIWHPKENRSKYFLSNQTDITASQSASLSGKMHSHSFSHFSAV